MMPGDLCKLRDSKYLFSDRVPIYNKCFKTVTATLTIDQVFLVLGVLQIPNDAYVSIFLLCNNKLGWIYEMPHSIVKI